MLLKPVLVELGATVPGQGLYLNQESWQDPESSAAWLEKWRLVIQSLL